MTSRLTLTTAALAACLPLAFEQAGTAFAQGCVPVRSAGSPLQPGACTLPGHEPWQVSAYYRYLYSDRYFQGSEELSDMPGMAPGQQVINEVHSFDLVLSYTFNSRLTLGLDLPIQYGKRTSREEHLGMDRIDLPQYSTSATGLGDLRLTADYWLLDPEKSPNGNISVGVGIKLPTGEYDATDTFQTPAGLVEQPVDQAIQPGDGGWGVVLQMQAFQRIIDRLNLYVNGLYLINPREENGTARVPVIMGGGAMPTTPDAFNSVPDQYLGRAGLSYDLWQKAGLSVSFGARMEGIPVSDLAGGDGGFRRPGYTLSVEPGLNLMYGRHNVSLTAPVAIERNRQRSETDANLNRGMYPGSFADWTLLVSYSFRF